nr:hypothetical protein [Tanacetum cinerariifolium]
MVRDGQLEFADFMKSSDRTLCELEAALLYDVGLAGYAYPFHDARKTSQDDFRTHGAVAFGVRARSGPRGWQPSRQVIVRYTSSRRHCYMTSDWLGTPTHFMMLAKQVKMISGHTERSRLVCELEVVPADGSQAGDDRAWGTVKNAQSLIISKLDHLTGRTLWCRAMMAQSPRVSQDGQPPKTTVVVAAEPV